MTSRAARKLSDAAEEKRAKVPRLRKSEETRDSGITEGKAGVARPDTVHGIYLRSSHVQAALTCTPAELRADAASIIHRRFP